MTQDVPSSDAPLPGRATTAGTKRYADRLATRLKERGRTAAPDHFQRPDDLWLSSLSLGTLRGDPGGVDDLLYRSVVGDLLDEGGNVFNTALSLSLIHI